MPPNFGFHLEWLCSASPTRRVTSFTFAPASTSLSTARR